MQLSYVVSSIRLHVAIKSIKLPKRQPSMLVYSYKMIQASFTPSFAGVEEDLTRTLGTLTVSSFPP